MADRDDLDVSVKLGPLGCGGCLVVLGLIAGTGVVLREAWARGWPWFAGALLACGLVWCAWTVIAQPQRHTTTETTND